MGDTSGIFHILYIYYRTYVGVCVTPFFFFFGVRCAQYKVHAQCSFAALAPHMPCMLLVICTKGVSSGRAGRASGLLKLAMLWCLFARWTHKALLSAVVYVSPGDFLQC